MDTVMNLLFKFLNTILHRVIAGFKHPCYVVMRVVMRDKVALLCELRLVFPVITRFYIDIVRMH